MVTGQLIFEPPKFDWHSEDQQQAFEEWKGWITLALEASSIPKDKWYTTIVGFLGQEGFKCWQNLEISKQPENRKIPKNIFNAFTNTLEILTSYWNYIDEIYNDIRQGEHKTINQLDQQIKNLIE